MYSRPKIGETEEDLLRLQEEFEKNKADNKFKPSVIPINENPKGTIINRQNNEAEVISRADIEEQLANTFEAIPSDVTLKTITEKKVSSEKPVLKFHKGRGFPQAKRRDMTLDPGKGSLFSQQIKRVKKEVSPMEVDSTPMSESTIRIEECIESCPVANKITPSNQTEQENMPQKSFVLMGSDSTQIHEENLNLMKQMTEQEIMEEREKLIATMDPAIVAYLKSRRKAHENQNPTIKDQNEVAEDIKVDDIESTSEIFTQPKADKWLNFDIIETNKLAWMQNVNIPELKKMEEFEARFDFEGWLLPYSDPEITEKNRILYHHGEEPGRPGYTLQELFQLSRSSVIQQKILALNSIANILALNSTGVYDEILDIPMEQIFFVVRFCLDDNTPAVLNASIKAMRNLVFSQIDETCLDGLLGFGLGLIHPTLAIDNDMEDDNTVNDQQLAERNVMKCLVRTEIVTRMKKAQDLMPRLAFHSQGVSEARTPAKALNLLFCRVKDITLSPNSFNFTQTPNNPSFCVHPTYILNTVKPPLETIVYCLDILMRIARDSKFLFERILECDGLLDSIIDNFVPKVMLSNVTTAYGAPLLQAVKLLKILSSRSKNIAVQFISRYKVLDSLVLYLSDDTFSANVNGLRLQTECMHFMILLLQYDLTADFPSILQPILVKLLDYHFKNTNLDMKTTFIRNGHIAALLLLLGKVVEKNYSFAVPCLSIILEKCLPKWSAQFMNLEEYACGKLQMISALISCLAAIRQYERNTVTDDIMKQIIGSKSFLKITDKIRSGSMLLNNYETHKSSSNLKTLEAASWNAMDHIVPIIQTNSCMPFLCVLSHYVTSIDNSEVKKAFLNHPNIQKYLNSLQKLQKFYLTNHWFARPETAFLMNVLKSSVSVKDSLDTSIFYELAVKSLCVFNSEQKTDIEFLLANIIFCSKFYPSDIMMAHLEIGQINVNLEISLNNLGEILEVYTQVLGLKNNVPDFSSICSIDISIGNVIPIDWIYTPILVLYSNQQENKTTLDEALQIFTIRNCLRWILIYETYFPYLVSSINPTDRFCRLACVFLGSDSLFLTEEVHGLLELCFKNVITKCEEDLNFDKEIQGLSNFQDFYTQLLEQYQGVSYGNILFGNVILVPLAQRHNTQFRKTLWSEYMGVVQILNVTPSQYLGNKDLFFEPPEEDLSLLKCYRRAIVNKVVRQHTVLYDIANYHVEKYISKKKINQQ